MGTKTARVWRYCEIEEKIELSFEIFARAHTQTINTYLYIPVHTHTHTQAA